MKSLQNRIELVTRPDVLQLLLTMSTFQAPSKEATEVSSVLDFRRTWVLRVSKFLINNMDEFAGDPYACHLLRTAFQCLAGSRLDDSVTRSRKSREQRQNTSGNPGSIAKHERNAFLEDITVKSVIHPKAGTISVSFQCYFFLFFLPEELRPDEAANTQKAAC